MTLASVLLFILMIFYFLRKNIISDYIIHDESKEKKAIFSNIEEGIFLMDREWKVSGEGSTFLTKIFGQEVKFGDDFKTLLASNVDKETLDNAVRFLNVLASKNVKGTSIEALNPLKLITLNVKNSKGGTITKYVSISFSKIFDGNKKVKSFLVVIQDSTEKKKLATDLQGEIKKNKDMFKILANLARSSKSVEISGLLKDLRKLLDVQNEKLKTGDRTDFSVEGFVKTLKNDVHGVKSECGLFGLDILQKILHDFESELITLQKSGTLDNQSLLSIPYRFKDILEVVEFIENIMGNSGSIVPQAAAQTSASNLGTLLQSMTEKMSSDYKKNVNLMYNGSVLEQTPVFQKNQDIFKTAFMHLVKNSVIHGLETAHARAEAGKAAFGTVSVFASMNTSRSAMQIHVVDDGAGVNVTKVREKVQALGLNTKPVESYSDTELMNFIFEHDFSTADAITVDAGRGIGLNYVKSKIEEIGGTIRIESVQGKYTDFVISFGL